MNKFILLLLLVFFVGSCGDNVIAERKKTCALYAEDYRDSLERLEVVLRFVRKNYRDKLPAEEINIINSHIDMIERSEAQHNVLWNDRLYNELNDHWDLIMIPHTRRLALRCYRSLASGR